MKKPMRTIDEQKVSAAADLLTTPRQMLRSIDMRRYKGAPEVKREIGGLQQAILDLQIRIDTLVAESQDARRNG